MAVPKRIELRGEKQDGGKGMEELRTEGGEINSTGDRCSAAQAGEGGWWGTRGGQKMCNQATPLQSK